MPKPLVLAFFVQKVKAFSVADGVAEVIWMRPQRAPANDDFTGHFLAEFDELVAPTTEIGGVSDENAYVCRTVASSQRAQGVTGFLVVKQMWV